MIPTSFREHFQKEIAGLRSAGLYKEERVLASPQRAGITLSGGKKAVNLCANNYLGLADSPVLAEAARKSLDEWGYGLASVRFICGTQEIHKRLEARISAFLGLEDTVLYSSCFDANGGLFETLLGEEDAVISDALNHASIIDGIRLCKARRLRYANNDMAELEARLQEAKDARFRLIATDGVFSMDGSIANLQAICDLADKYQALVMVDDSHAVGVLGEGGRGTPEHCGVMGRIDVITGTLGKALGGASGGYTAARGFIAEWLRQRSRPYLFSNTLAPSIASASLAALDLCEKGTDLRRRLRENSAFFRAGLEKAGFKVLPGSHPIIPVMIGDSALAKTMADKLLGEGVYVIAFSYPVVPQGLARIRTQMSAALQRSDLEAALEAFGKVGKDVGVLK